MSPIPRSRRWPRPFKPARTPRQPQPPRSWTSTWWNRRGTTRGTGRRTASPSTATPQRYRNRTTPTPTCGTSRRRAESHELVGRRRWARRPTTPYSLRLQGNAMYRFVARRLLSGVVLLVVLTCLTFFLLYATGGD